MNPRTLVDPRFVACFLSVLLVSCGGGGGATSGGTTGGGGATSSLTYLSLSASTGSPFTALNVRVKDGNTDPVSVTFSNTAGYSVTGPAIKVTTAAVEIPIPLYIDPATHDSAQGAVSIVLTQDGHSTAPASFTIQDLPPLSAYGVSAGQISHDFLIFEQLLLAHSMNEMSAVNAASTNSTVVNETGGAMGDLYNTLIPAVSDSRFDVDQAMNFGTVSSWGITPGGHTLQFDSDQLQFMDRVLAVYLTQQFGTLTAVKSRVERMPEAVNRNGQQAVTLSVSLSLMTTLNGVYELLADARKASDSTADAGVAAAGAAEMTLGATGAEEDAHFVGLVSGMGHVMQSVTGMTTGILKVPDCIVFGCDDAAGLQSDIQNNALNVASAEASMMSHVDGLLDLENDLSTSLSQSLKAFINVHDFFTGGGATNLADAVTSAVGDVGYPTLFGSMGEVSGSVGVTNTLGAAGSLPAVQLQQCSPGTCPINFYITAGVDQGGSYDFVVPENVSGINYSSMDVLIFDPTANVGLVSETVDLSGLNTSAPVTVPAMSYTCNDTDYSAPDGDDPDCD